MCESFARKRDRTKEKRSTVCACMLSGLRARKSINESLLTAMYCSESNIITLFSFEFPFCCTYCLPLLCLPASTHSNMPYTRSTNQQCCRSVCTYPRNTPSFFQRLRYFTVRDIMAIAWNTIKYQKNSHGAVIFTNVDHIPFLSLSLSNRFQPHRLASNGGPRHPTAAAATASTNFYIAYDETNPCIIAHSIHSSLSSRSFSLLHIVCSFLPVAFMHFKLTIFMR